jgi:hypothetical protein
LTRDRRGFEHTFLLHADRPGEAPRVLYWYRTAPEVLIGRPALDEEAIRTIEDQHPEIEFDWPAILALREAMTPEEEAQPERPPRRQRQGGRRGPSAPPDESSAQAADDQRDESPEEDAIEVAPPTTHGLLEELVGREIATRLRARHAEVLARINERDFDQATRDQWTTRADALDPDTWLTPEAILDGVNEADRRFEELRAALVKTAYT